MIRVRRARDRATPSPGVASEGEPGEGRSGWRRLAPFAGPALIVGSVLVLLHDFAFAGRLSTQHPDVLAFWLPNYCFLGKTLASAHVPAWNPFAMGGLPFAADPQSGWLYGPAMALFAALPCGTAMAWLIVLQPVLAGLGLYWFLRSEGVSRPSATAGGAAVALGLAATTLTLFLPFPSFIAWTLLLLAACSRYVHAERASRRVLWALVAALAWGQLAGAHAGHGLVVGSAFALVYLAGKCWERVRDGVWSGRTALGLLTPLPAAFVLVNLAVVVPRLAYLPRTSYHLGFARLSQPLGLEPGWPLRVAASPGGHVAAALLAVAFAALWSRRHRWLAITLAAFGLVSYVLSLKVVVDVLAPRLAHTPILSLYRHYPNRLGMGLLIVIPALGALGLEAWREDSSWGRRAAMAAPGVATWFVLPPLLGAGLAPLIPLAVGGLVAGVLLVVAVRRPRLLAVVAVVAVLELVANGIAGQAKAIAPPGPPFPGYGWFVPLASPRVDSGAYLRAGPIVTAMREDPDHRYLGLAPERATSRGYLTRQRPFYWGLLVDQRGMLFRLQDVQGYNPFQVSRYWSFVRAIAPRTLDYNAAVLLRPTPQSLDLLDVGWVIGPRGRPPLPGAVPVTTERAWELYRFPGAPSRASVVGRWRVVAGASAALAAVTAPGFDPAGEAIVERPVGLAHGPPGGEDRAAGNATYRPLGAQSAEVTVSAARPAVVVIRNVYDQNWHATLDGRPAPVLVVDSLVQGVAVSAGRHTIRLSYDDPSIGYGLAGSGVAVAALLAAFLVALRAERKRSRPIAGADR